MDRCEKVRAGVRRREKVYRGGEGYLIGESTWSGEVHGDMGDARRYKEIQGDARRSVRCMGMWGDLGRWRTWMSFSRSYPALPSHVSTSLHTLSAAARSVGAPTKTHPVGLSASAVVALTARRSAAASAKRVKWTGIWPLRISLALRAMSPLGSWVREGPRVNKGGEGGATCQQRG